MKYSNFPKIVQSLIWCLISPFQLNLESSFMILMIDCINSFQLFLSILRGEIRVPRYLILSCGLRTWIVWLSKRMLIWVLEFLLMLLMILVLSLLHEMLLILKNWLAVSRSDSILDLESAISARSSMYASALGAL